jgi:hypothetical protein
MRCRPPPSRGHPDRALRTSDSQAAHRSILIHLDRARRVRDRVPRYPRRPLPRHGLGPRRQRSGCRHHSPSARARLHSLPRPGPPPQGPPSRTGPPGLGHSTDSPRPHNHRPPPTRPRHAPLGLLHPPAPVPHSLASWPPTPGPHTAHPQARTRQLRVLPPPLSRNSAFSHLPRSGPPLIPRQVAQPAPLSLPLSSPHAQPGPA